MAQEKAQTEELRRDFARQQALQSQRDWQMLNSKDSDEDRRMQTPGAGRSPMQRPPFRELEPSPRTPTPRPDLRAFTTRKADTPLSNNDRPAFRRRDASLPWGERLGMSKGLAQAEPELAETEIEMEEQVTVAPIPVQRPAQPTPLRNRSRFSRVSTVFQRDAAARATKAERAKARKLAAKSQRLRRQEEEQHRREEEQRQREEEQYAIEEDHRIREDAQREIEELQLQREEELREKEVMVQAKLEKLKIARMKEKQRQAATLEALEQAQREREMAEQAEQEVLARQAELEDRARALEKRRRREERQRIEEEERERREQEAYEMAHRHRRQRSAEPSQPMYPTQQSGYSRGPTPQQQQAQMMQLRCVLGSFCFLYLV
jgi:hypothetical protein